LFNDISGFDKIILSPKFTHQDINRFISQPLQDFTFSILEKMLRENKVDTKLKYRNKSAYLRMQSILNSVLTITENLFFQKKLSTSKKYHHPFSYWVTGDRVQTIFKTFCVVTKSFLSATLFKAFFPAGFYCRTYPDLPFFRIEYPTLKPAQWIISQTECLSHMRMNYLWLCLTDIVRYRPGLLRLRGKKLLNDNRGMPKRKVAVTGIGIVCPLGISTQQTWENMTAGKSGIKMIDRFDAASCMTRIGGQIPDEFVDREKEFFSLKIMERTTPPARLALFTAFQALKQARLNIDELRGTFSGVITGCGGSTYGDEISAGQQEKVTDYAFYHEMINASAIHVSRCLGWKGPAYNVATACSSGAFALAMAYDFVSRSGNLCLAIGVDTMLMKETVDGFNALMALSEQNDAPEKASRPFDRKRSGFVLSEGACSVVLEPYDVALARGAEILSVFSGGAMTSEAYNIIAPEPDGKKMARTMEEALFNSGVAREKIGYISAHGTSTLHNDLAEAKAIKRVFGDLTSGIAVTSQKSMIGHSIGAAGTIEFAITALSLYHKMVTPNINYEFPDREFCLENIPTESKYIPNLQAAMTNSFGFGGHNCCLILHVP
jgi:3-oxoacyl-[acyl-carrier-protein] synthase II